jgi:predicted NAD/FAD-binding protein
VSLSTGPESIDPKKIIRRFVYHHPVYDPEGLKARKRCDEINGVNRTYFCGAYWGYGFHEDGVNSALEVCRHFGRSLNGPISDQLQWQGIEETMNIAVYMKGTIRHRRFRPRPIFFNIAYS